VIGDMKMEEKIITTKKGIYGRVNITLPLPMKTSMLAWAKKSGMKKAEFLRLALTTGFLELSKSVLQDIDDRCEAEQQPART
jgi:hypothetical protein